MVKIIIIVIKQNNITVFKPIFITIKCPTHLQIIFDFSSSYMKLRIKYSKIKRNEEPLSFDSLDVEIYKRIVYLVCFLSFINDRIVKIDNNETMQRLTTKQDNSKITNPIE